MSTNINQNVLKNFLTKDLGIHFLTKTQTKEYDIKTDEFEAADIDDNNYLDIDEILDNGDVYERFATLYVEEQEKKAEAKDKEKEKEEQSKVSDKSDAKA